jgi:RpiB/LacA/LacB family sugar-phosphate isomerase
MKWIKSHTLAKFYWGRGDAIWRAKRIASDQTCFGGYPADRRIAMRIVLGADHAGFELKRDLVSYVRGLGHEVLDVGAASGAQPDDYPDFAEAVGMAVRNLQADRGILVCGSGVGASVAANKIPAVRAGLCHDSYSAHQGVEHDDMNVLVLGSRVIASELAHELVRHFLGAKFSGEERHARRLEKVKRLEAKFLVSREKP